QRPGEVGHKGRPRPAAWPGRCDLDQQHAGEGAEEPAGEDGRQPTPVQLGHDASLYRVNGSALAHGSREPAGPSGWTTTTGALAPYCPSMPSRAATPPMRCCAASSPCRDSLPPTRRPTVMTALGNNVHLFARPHRRQDLIWCFETVLGCGPVATVQHPGMNEPMLLVRFPGGGHLSIEFLEEAPDEDTPRLGAWLELRTENPAALMQAALDAGLTQVQHPGHPYYFMAPGGQVFTMAPQTRALHDPAIQCGPR